MGIDRVYKEATFYCKGPPSQFVDLPPMMQTEGPPRTSRLRVSLRHCQSGRKRFFSESRGVLVQPLHMRPQFPAQVSAV
jgi:hypothetical protein